MPKYDLDAIRFGTDAGTFKRALGLFEAGKVRNFKAGEKSYTATVIGTHPYEVFVEDRRFDYGSCTCYLGENDELCKHMVAVAIHAVKNGRALTDEDKEIPSGPSCSGTLGSLDAEALAIKRGEITHALRHIKPYDGPSRLWFSYQHALDEGCRRLSAIVSSLPVSRQTTDLLVTLLLRLDKKLCESGVDDSDGTVGGFMESVVLVLQEFAKMDSSCSKAFDALAGRQTSFGWEEPLLKIARANDKTAR